MNAKPEIGTIQTGFLNVLSISPLEEDHLSLQAVFHFSKWMLFKADRVSRALSLLQEHDISVIVCEADAMPGAWTEVLQHIQKMPNSPALIVTSRVADEHLWAEALNLGAWDVLAKPFSRTELIRTVKTAWNHWHYQIESAPKTIHMASAAS